MLRSTTGDGNQFHATTMTNLYSTVKVCTSYLVSTDNGSALESGFSYSLPNMTLVRDLDASGEGDFADACANPHNKTTDAPPGTERHFQEMILYYWNDETLNSTWWSHFQSDPFTSDYDEWYAWGFYPTNASNFECNQRAASARYQSSSPQRSQT